LKNIKSIEEYNKDQEDLNNRLFIKVDDILGNKCEELISLKDEEPLKVEDFEEDKIILEGSIHKKSEDSINSAEFVQETRSEESKEDQNRLDDSFAKSKSKYAEEQKEKLNNEKRNTLRNKKNKRKESKNKRKKEGSVKMEEIKEDNLVKKDSDSEPDA